MWRNFPQLHGAVLKQPLPDMQVSKRILFVSYRLSTMPSVVCQDIFPWSPVSPHNSQQCCQNSRAASAESICKVSSWALASSGALQYPVILHCLWPFSATQSFLQLSQGLHRSLISQPVLIVDITLYKGNFPFSYQQCV